MSGYTTKTYVVQQADREGVLGDVLAVKLTHAAAHAIAKRHARAIVHEDFAAINVANIEARPKCVRRRVVPPHRAARHRVRLVLGVAVPADRSRPGGPNSPHRGRYRSGVRDAPTHRAGAEARRDPPGRRARQELRLRRMAWQPRVRTGVGVGTNDFAGA